MKTNTNNTKDSPKSNAKATRKASKSAGTKGPQLDGSSEYVGGGWTTSDLYPHESLVRFRDFVQLKDYRPRTQKTYVSHPRLLGRHFSCDPETIIEEQVEEYLLHLRKEKGYASSSMRQTIAALRMFYHDFLKIEPAWDIFSKIRVRDDVKLPVVLTREEVASILGHVQRDRFKTSLRLIYFCGLRLSEALDIEVGDIDGAAGRIHIRNGKGGKQRMVPLGKPMIEELRRFWRRHQHPKFLFPALGKGYKLTTKCRDAQGVAEEQMALELVQNAKARMSGGTVQSAFKRALAASRVKKEATPHTLRHSYATHMIELGVNIRYLSMYLGHASLEQTVRYVHLTAVSEGQTLAAIDELYRGPKS